MTTGVGLTQISLAQLNLPNTKTPYLVQEFLWYLLYKLSNGPFSDEICQFLLLCCHGNKGGSNKNSNDSVWLVYPKTPSSMQKSGTYIKCKLTYGEFCVKISKFCCHGNRGCLTEISVTQSNRPTQKTPYLEQESWWYLLYKLSNGRFSVEIYQFQLPWQQVWV